MQYYINRVICCECCQGMSEIPDNFVDLTVTSPPFDNLRTYNGYHFDYECVLQQLYRITKPGGVVVWVVADQTIKGSETGTSFKQALYAKSVGFYLHDTMIYMNRVVRFPHPKRYHNCFQYMFIFSKGVPKTANLIRDKLNKTAGRVETSKYQREEDGSWRVRSAYKTKRVRPKYSVRLNVWEYKVGSRCMADDRLWTKHPAVFPMKLAEDHIKTWSNEGELVFDPMCGSGQTLCAAKKLKRNYLGMDVCEEYCKLSEERLKLY